MTAGMGESAIPNPQLVLRSEALLRRAVSAIRILAVHPGALGDVVLFGHLLRRLGGRVTLVAGREKGELLAGLGVAERALDFEALPMHEIFTDTDLARCGLPKLLGQHDRLVSCFAGGNRRAELRLAAACGASEAAFLPVRPDEACRSHLLDLWADLLGHPPAAPAEASAPWPVPLTWRDAAAEALGQTGAEATAAYVILSPGAGSPTKCWPIDQFVEVARDLDGAAARAVFVVGPVECERWPAEVVDSLRSEFPVLISPPLPTLAGVLAGARATVANDSGPGHLAAAVGTPTISLFGPTRARHFAPIGPSVTVLAEPTLQDISAARVLEAVRG